MATVISPLTRATVVNRLRWIIDPELGVDIVTLGLIYDLTVRGGTVHIAMTLTAPGCPLRAVLADAIRDTLYWMDGVERVEVSFVWDPPWHPGMIAAGGGGRMR
jgi:metal-sulfur cluster biosynthetic enzyme